MAKKVVLVSSRRPSPAQGSGTVGSASKESAAMSVEVSQEAYRTIVLHCAKHPAAAITGLLLAPKGSQTVVKAIPLQHHWNELSPMIEVGCSLAQAHAASLANPLDVVGLYFAPSDVPSSQRQQIHPIALKIAQMIAARTGSNAIVLQVNNAELASKTEHPFLAFHAGPSAASNLAALPSGSLSVAGGQDAVASLRSDVVQGRWKGIVDFDDHLENTSLNWLESAA